MIEIQILKILNKFYQTTKYRLDVRTSTQSGSVCSGNILRKKKEDHRIINK